MNTFGDYESIQEITKDIDCIQETQQYAVSVEHHWSISDIQQLSQSKRPGEKIESEQFAYKPVAVGRNHGNKQEATCLCPCPDQRCVITSFLFKSITKYISKDFNFAQLHYQL